MMQLKVSFAAKVPQTRFHFNKIGSLKAENSLHFEKIKIAISFAMLLYRQSESNILHLYLKQENLRSFMLQIMQSCLICKYHKFLIHLRKIVIQNVLYSL